MTATYSQNAIIPVTPLLTLIDNTSKKEKKKKKKSVLLLADISQVSTDHQIFKNAALLAAANF